MNDNVENDPRLHAMPDIHGHAKGEHKAFTDERPIPLSARMLFLWFYHACRRGSPRFLMVTDHMNYLTFEDPAAINLVRRALKLAQAGDLYGAAETASVEVGHAAVVSEGLRRGMRYSIGAEVDNDPRSRPDAQNIVDAMKPDGMIRSVHFLTIDHPVHGPNWNWPFDNPEFADVYELVGTAKTWEIYMATLLDAIERLPGNIVGHFYVPALFGHWPDDATLERYEDQLVEACEARGMAVEVNTRFLYREHSEEEKLKYLAAHRRLLAKCKAKNVGVAIGSDAHSPKDQGGAFARILALLDECEINELVFPLAGRLARVALRVERKVEPVPEPIAQPPADRKAARKARPSESAARETASVALAEAPRAKSRPKRSKSKDVEAPDSSAGKNGDGHVAVVEDDALDAVEVEIGATTEAPTTTVPVVESDTSANSVDIGEWVATDSVAEIVNGARISSIVRESPSALADDETDGASAFDEAPESRGAFGEITATPSDGIHHDGAHVHDAHHDDAHHDDAHHDDAHHDVAHHEDAHRDDAHHDGAHHDGAGQDDTHHDPLDVAGVRYDHSNGVGRHHDHPNGVGLQPADANVGGVQPDDANVDDDDDGSGSEHAGEQIHSDRRPRSKSAATKSSLPGSRVKAPAVKPKSALKKTVKAAPKKPTAKKVTAKKTVVAVGSAKKAAPQKATAKKASPPKGTGRATAVKKSAGKRSAAKKATPKKSAQRRR